MGLGLSAKIENTDGTEGLPTPQVLLSSINDELTNLILCGTDGFETAYIRIEDMLALLERHPGYKQITDQYPETQTFWNDLYHRIRNAGPESKTITQTELAKAIDGYRELYRHLQEYCKG